MPLIQLTQGLQALVDDDVFEEMSAMRWYAVRMGTKQYPLFYAARANGRRMELMHRRITEAPEGTIVDHINNNSLDNRKTNLRVCSQRDNAQNKRSQRNKNGFRGVSQASLNTFRAWITRDGNKKYLGNFPNAESAARAYDAAAIDAFGEFAKLNFPE